jgi:hypothetical protein
MFLGTVIGSSQRTQHGLEAMSSIRGEVARAAHALQDSTGIPAQFELRTSTLPNASGTSGQIKRLTLEIINRIVAQHNEYPLELDAIHWDTILDPHRIEQDTTLSESRVMVDQAMAIIDKYEMRTATLAGDMRAQIDALPISEALQKEMFSELSKGLNNDRVREKWELERKSVDQVKKIIELLATSNRGTDWRIEGDQFYFANSDILKEFNAHLDVIDRIVEQQEQMRKESIVRNNRRFDQVKRMSAD